MIDIHSHILPGIDDGAQSWEDSFVLAEAAVQEGITHILATPHHLNGKYTNKKAEVVQLTAELQQRLAEKAIPLQVFPAQEVRLSGEILEGIAQDEILFADEGNRYLLVELPTLSIPHYAEALFFQLQQKGIVPVIVHPERNRPIQEDPGILLDYVEKGLLAQVTASSYAGVFGKKTAEISSQLIEANLVHVLASDAHNTRGRTFHMQEAFLKLEKEFGATKVEQFHKQAKQIINGERIEIESPRAVKQKKRFWHFLQRGE